MKMGLKYKICAIVKAEQENCQYLAVKKKNPYMHHVSIATRI
jgi:uncharacterized protein YcgL (UPF0745 family)